MDDYLTKPLRENQLDAVLGRYLGLSGAAGDGAAGFKGT